MAGAQGFVEIEDCGIAHEEWLRNYLGLENGIPSHDTINRVFQSLKDYTLLVHGHAQMRFCLVNFKLMAKAMKLRLSLTS